MTYWQQKEFKKKNWGSWIQYSFWDSQGLEEVTALFFITSSWLQPQFILMSFSFLFLFLFYLVFLGGPLFEVKGVGL